MKGVWTKRKETKNERTKKRKERTGSSEGDAKVVNAAGLSR